MTKAKEVAASLKDTVSNPIVLRIQDRSKPIDDIIDTVLGYWNYDLMSRKPSAAYTADGVFQGTDLDLAVFLFSLAGRNAVINLPKYTSMRSTKVVEGTEVVSKDNRHGKILGVQANKNSFVFSIRIMDMNVVKEDSVGDFRSFSLTDFDGSWYDGWKTIGFSPDAKENDFIKKSKIMTDNRIVFKNFIHPNRWVSFYGQYYFITKLLIARMTAESSDMFAQIKRMKAAGFDVATKEYGETVSVSESKSVKIKAFEAIIDFPEDGSNFPEYQDSQENLDMLVAKRNSYTYSLIPLLRFMTRATECAFYNNMKEKGLNTFPSWIKNVKWEEGYKPKGAKTTWNRIVLYQPSVGKQGVSIRFREYEKSEQVNESYVGKAV